MSQRGTKIIIGIDPSLTATGVCVGDTRRVYGMKTIKLKKKYNRDTRFFRYLDIASEVDDFFVDSIPEGTEGPFYIHTFIEGYSYGITPRSNYLVTAGEFGGFLRMFFMGWKSTSEYSNVYEVPPMSLKKYLTGIGNATKKRMVEMAELIKKDYLYRGEIQDDNQADAFGLYFTGLKYLQDEEKYDKVRRLS